MQSGGLASQLNSLQNYCKQQGIVDYKIFQDENVSGAKQSRPALDAMLKEVAEGKCKTVVCFSFSRFSRSCSHLLQSLEQLKKYNTRLVSVTEQIDTSTPVGQALLAVLGALAQLERDLIRERVKAGLERAKMLGRPIGRKKTRDSELIRSLLKSGMTLRAAARVAKTSHGSVSLERKLMRQEEAAAKSGQKTAENKQELMISTDQSNGANSRASQVQIESTDAQAESPYGNFSISIS